MNRLEVISVLDRLLQTLCRSLPRYLEDARPWTRRGDQKTIAALTHIVADQRELAQRVAEAIVEHGGRPDPGRFPMEFTAINDLQLDFVLKKLIEYQQRDVETIQRCAADLDEAPMIRALAEEALGNAKGHRDLLEGLKIED